MPQVLSTVTLERKSGIPRDAVQMDFAWATSAALDTGVLDAITTKLRNFFTVLNTGQSAILSSYLGASVSIAGHSIKHYDITGHLNGSAHGAPLQTDPMTFAVSGVGTDSLPTEVAVCLSFHSDYGTDVEFGPATRPRSRDRGRIFFGPLKTGIIVPDAVTKRPQVALALQTDLTQAALMLMAGPDPTWSVWSRKKAALASVTSAWVDDAFDVQRRRGEDPVFRITV